MPELKINRRILVFLNMSRESLVLILFDLIPGRVLFRKKGSGSDHLPFAEEGCYLCNMQYALDTTR